MKKIVVLLLLLCFTLMSCNKSEEQTVKDEPSDVVMEPTPNVIGPYAPSNTNLSFSNKNLNKVITEPTFDITQSTKDVGEYIMPYAYFSDGMCLQRDAVNRIWGKASKTKNIAIEIGGQVYYGSVNGFEWEVY